MTIYIILYPYSINPDIGHEVSAEKKKIQSQTETKISVCLVTLKLHTTFNVIQPFLNKNKTNKQKQVDIQY